jgi:DNA invertase Pin-like site-specific DNA recombinase
MRRKADERREKSIRRMRADGVSLREIAQAMNTSRSQVEKVLARSAS